MARIAVHLDPEYVPWGHTKQRRSLPKGAGIVFAVLLLVLGSGVLYFGIASQSETKPDASVVEVAANSNGGETLDLPPIPIPDNEPGQLIVVQKNMVTLFRCNPSQTFVILAGGETITRAAESGVTIEVDQPIEGVSCE